MKKLLVFPIFIKIIGCSVFLLALGNAKSFAQPQRPAMDEKIESLRIAYITNRLQLTPKESQDFWPVYNEYQAEIKKIQDGMRTSFVSIANKSDAEVEADLYKTLEMREKELKLHRTYLERFKKVIPIRKIAILVNSEREFKQHLIDRAREHRRPNE